MDENQSRRHAHESSRRISSRRSALMLRRMAGSSGSASCDTLVQQDYVIEDGKKLKVYAIKDGAESIDTIVKSKLVSRVLSSAVAQSTTGTSTTAMKEK